MLHGTRVRIRDAEDYDGDIGKVVEMMPDGRIAVLIEGRIVVFRERHVVVLEGQG